ncbi:15792_t:CDS:2, partial [Acaulospora colombiana]
DGPMRLTPELGSKNTPSAPGYLAGSKALDSLAQFITSKELLFHPSQNSAITRQLTALTESLSRRFVYRWTEEASDTCKTPQSKRLTKEMKKAFVELLCTPVLMSIFSKDGDTAARSRATLRSLAYLEPGVIMPPFLERAYNGLEAINETHRTTAVLHAMAEVALPLVSEDVWFGGQKHILPLLELCLPGIDLNDPVKTVATASFLTNILMTVPIVNLVGKDEIIDVPMSPLLDRDGELAVGASEDREAERTMVVETLVDWVMAFFDRCLTLYEALPEEGGRSKRTGGKQEEAML